MRLSNDASNNFRFPTEGVGGRHPSPPTGRRCPREGMNPRTSPSAPGVVLPPPLPSPARYGTAPFCGRDGKPLLPPRTLEHSSAAHRTLVWLLLHGSQLQFETSDRKHEHRDRNTGTPSMPELTGSPTVRPSAVHHGYCNIGLSSTRHRASAEKRRGTGSGRRKSTARHGTAISQYQLRK